MKTNAFLVVVLRTRRFFLITDVVTARSVAASCWRIADTYRYGEQIAICSATRRRRRASDEDVCLTRNNQSQSAWSDQYSPEPHRIGSITVEGRTHIEKSRPRGRSSGLEKRTKSNNHGPWSTNISVSSTACKTILSCAAKRGSWSSMVLWPGAHGHRHGISSTAKVSIVSSMTGTIVIVSSRS